MSGPFPTISTLAIVEAFQELPDARCGAGRRHEQALCLALFTLAVSAGCRGFLAISDLIGCINKLSLLRIEPSLQACLQ